MTPPPISVSIMETGTVRIRPSLKTQPASRPVILRRLRILTESSWTEPLPIYAFLIAHPEGPILFDTGESPRCNDPGYYPWYTPGPNMVARTTIGPHEGIVSRLRERGLAPTDLKAVVLSHLHHDHCGGLRDLAGPHYDHAHPPADIPPIYVSDAHWSAFKSPLTAHMEGAAPHTWPKPFTPRLISTLPAGPSLPDLGPTRALTTDNRVLIIDTPGHTPGHISLLVDPGASTGLVYLLAGDATYSQDLLDRELTDGINDDPKTAVATVRRIKQFARGRPVVLLPAHDPDALGRLERGEVYVPTEIGAGAGAGGER